MHTMQQHQNRNMSFNFFEYPFFMGIFGIPQKRICADFAPIRLVNTLLSVAKV